MLIESVKVLERFSLISLTVQRFWCMSLPIEYVVSSAQTFWTPLRGPHSGREEPSSHSGLTGLLPIGLRLCNEHFPGVLWPSCLCITPTSDLRWGYSREITCWWLIFSYLSRGRGSTRDAFYYMWKWQKSSRDEFDASIYQAEKNIILMTRKMLKSTSFVKAPCFQKCLRCPVEKAMSARERVWDSFFPP